MAYDADAIIVGAGLAGLVAAAELVEAGKRVIVLDQEPEQSLGGQAFWSLGGIFLVNSPEQRRMRIRDSHALALDDWMGTAAFDRDEDFWPRQWAEAYVAFAAGEKRAWLHERGRPLLPSRRLGRARRRTTPSATAIRCRAFISPGEPARECVAPFIQRVREGEKRGLRRLQVPASGQRTDAKSGARRRRRARRHPRTERTSSAASKSSREVVGAFELRAQAVIVASGGIGANHELVRKNWPQRLGTAPKRMITGVPDHVDGRMLAITEAAGGTIINRDRMWHYVEGIKNWNPIWTDARHPHPARSVVALARRARQAAAGAALSRLRHARHAQAHHGDRLRLFVVHAHATDHREGIRAVRFGAESRLDQQELAAGARAARAAAFRARSRPSWTRAKISSSNAICRRWCSRMNALDRR